MKIIYDAQIFRKQRYGGISRYYCEVAGRVAKTPGVWARVLAPNHHNEYLPHIAPGTLLGWRQPQGQLLGRIAGLGASALVRGAMVTARPDILHETYYSDSWKTPEKTARVLTVYDMIHERYFGPQDPTSLATRQAVARADHVICISEATRRDVMEMIGAPAAKLSVIHLAAHMQPPRKVTDVPGAPYLLYVGLRGAYKNFKGLLAAVGASPVLKQFQIVCFGGGPLTPAEWEIVDSYRISRSQVLMRSGDDEVLAGLYAGAACFVYPSLYEGFGIPPLEAMLCSCPVACSNTSSIPEVVRDAGAYFDPTDRDSMRQTLEDVLSSPSRQDDLRSKGHALAAEYSWDRCAAETLGVYRRVANGKSQRA